MKRKIYLLIIMVLCSVFSITRVDANSLFKAKDTLVVDKPINGTAFIAGNNIKLESSVNGISFVAGNNIKINHEQEYLFTAGNDIVLTEDVTKDLFLAGANIEIKGSNLKRDAYIAGGNITIDGNVLRNIYILGENIELSGTYNGNVYINAGKLNLNKDTIINGTLKYNEDTIVTGLTDSIKVKTYHNREETTFINYLSSTISSFVRILIVALVLVYLFEKLLNKINKDTNNINLKEVLLNIGKGLLILIGVPIVLLMLIITGIFTSLGIIGLALYLILIYISNILSAYVLAITINKKLIKKDTNNYVLVTFGLLAIYLLRIIPVIGGLISLISILFGVGYIGNIIIELKK